MQLFLWDINLANIQTHKKQQQIRFNDLYDMNELIDFYVSNTCEQRIFQQFELVKRQIKTLRFKKKKISQRRFFSLLIPLDAELYNLLYLWIEKLYTKDFNPDNILHWSYDVYFSGVLKQYAPYRVIDLKDYTKNL